MCKHTARKLAFVLLLALLAGPVDRAFASSTGQSSTSTTTSTTSTTATTDGITGTDPEPIEPDIVSILLTLLGLG
jgi:hypothetical protein